MWEILKKCLKNQQQKLVGWGVAKKRQKQGKTSEKCRKIGENGKKLEKSGKHSQIKEKKNCEKK